MVFFRHIGITGFDTLRYLRSRTLHGNELAFVHTKYLGLTTEKRDYDGGGVRGVARERRLLHSLLLLVLQAARFLDI